MSPILLFHHLDSPRRIFDALPLLESGEDRTFGLRGE